MIGGFHKVQDCDELDVSTAKMYFNSEKSANFLFTKTTLVDLGLYWSDGVREGTHRQLATQVAYFSNDIDLR